MPTRDARLTDPSRICLSLFKPKSDNSGMLTRERVVTMAELRDQLIQSLKVIIVPGFEQCDAYQIAESFFVAIRDFQLEDQHFLEGAEGRIMIAPAKGRCEGDLIRILFLKDDGTYLSLFHIKYLIDTDLVWSIARKLSDALENGR